MPNSVLPRSSEKEQESKKTKKQKNMQTIIRHKRRDIPMGSAARLSQQGSTRIGGSFGVLLFLIVLSGGYVFSVNSNAVQGYHMRHLEKTITDMREENARLRILEADTKSFQRIEEASGSLVLERADTPQYFEERDVVALR